MGGSNFDEAMLEIYAEQYQAQANAELYTDDRQRRRCIQAAEDAKKMLSKLVHIQDTIGNDQDGIARIDITRDSYETKVSGLVTRTVMLIEQALDSAHLQVSDIDHVLLVGGSTRIPKVRKMLKQFFGKAPTSCGNVDEAVALGAALFARRASQITEVCNHGYGTIALIEDASSGEAELQNSIVIAKNTPIPCSYTQTYLTSEDNETEIEVDITQGEDHDPKFVDIIGRLVLEVPEGRPAGCRVTVTYSYDENQRVRALVTDEETGVSKEIAISYQGGGSVDRGPDRTEICPPYPPSHRVDQVCLHLIPLIPHSSTSRANVMIKSLLNRFRKKPSRPVSAHIEFPNDPESAQEAALMDVIPVEHTMAELEEIATTIHEEAESYIPPRERCGITPEMSEEEIRAHLALLYRRYNRCSSSLDQDLRMEAEVMLDAIIEVRESLAGEVSGQS